MSTHLIERTRAFSLSNTTGAGAINISDNGGSFDVRLDPPLLIPRNAINPILSLRKATVWWSTPNVISGVNDTFSISAPNTADIITAYTVTLDEGLYSIDALNISIQESLATQGAKVSPEPVVIVDADYTTNRSILYLPYVGTTVDFSVDRNFARRLGFDETPLPTTIAVDTVYTSQSTANVAPTEHYLVSCSLVDDGILIGNNRRNIIARVQIDVPSNSQITYEPFRPIELACARLAGNTIDTLSLQLRGDDLSIARTGGEPWTADIIVSWNELVRV